MLGEECRRGCSTRAVAVGLFGAAVMAWAIPYGDAVIQGSQLGVWNTNPGAIFLFFVLVAMVNTGLAKMHHSLALDRSELAVVYVMLLVANTLPARGFSGYIPPVLTGAFYYANPENNWSELVQPYLPSWATVQDRVAVERYYEGDASNPTIPWDVWAWPLFSWFLFALGLYLVMVSASVILRRQWVERERLVYPMMQLPLYMLQEDARAPSRPVFLGNRSMWLGFALPFVFDNLNALHDYFHFIPAPSTSFGGATLFRGTVGINFSLSFTMVGFSYLISRNIAAGLCFFYLLSVVLQGVLNVLGADIDRGPVGAFGFYAGPIIMYQAMGGMIILVIAGLWNARAHLCDVFRKAFVGAVDVDDSEEMMSYRQAVGGCTGGCAVIALWLWIAGVPAWIVPLLLFGCFVVFLTITRVVVEGGVAVMFPPIVAPDFVSAAVGVSALGHRGLAGLTTTYVWATDILVLLMTACSNGLKVAELAGPQRRRLFWAVAATVIVVIGISIWVRLDAGYTHGAINLNSFYAANAAQYPYSFMQRVLAGEGGAHVQGWIQIGIGALLMLALEILHYKYTWWPFHPLGFPISSAFGSMWFSVFFAVLIKSTVLRYGGPKLYRRTVPFFMGLILGEIIPAGFWLAIDGFSGMQGNVLGSFMN